MKASPDLRPLGSQASVIAGQSPEGIYYNNSGDGLPFYQGKKDFGERELQPPTVWTSQTTKEAQAGDILMSVRAPVGPINFASETVCIGRGLAAIRCHGELEPDFLFYQLLGMQADIAGKEGAVFASINKAEIEALPIVVFARPEQHRIVAILDEAFEGIATAKANAEKNLHSARALQKVAMRKRLDAPSSEWRSCTIGDQITLQRGFDITKSDQRPGKVPVVSSGGIRSHHDTAMVRSPGVVMGRKGTLGKVFYLSEDFWPHDTTLWVKDFKGNHPRFVYRFFEALDVLHLDSGAANPALNRNVVHAIPVVWPPLAEQIAIADQIDDLSASATELAAIYASKLAALDELKKSLLHQAFTGQLTSSMQALPAALKTTTPEFSANVISFAHARHERQRRERTFGHVKEQKILHLIESLAGIDLGRQPMRDVAGPNDFQHMRNAEKWAKTQGFFDMVKNGEGYEFRKLSDFDQHMSRARLALGPYLTRIEPVIDLLVPMDTEDAEVFATVHAAWNNLVIDELPTTDDAILYAARDGWHPDKLRISEHKFRSAIEMIRQKKLEPDGSAKYVGGQRSLL